MNDETAQAGYYVELAEGGPWLTSQLTWTPFMQERGVWTTLAEAEAAMRESLEKEKGEQ